MMLEHREGAFHERSVTSQAGAMAALRCAWPHVVGEARAVLGGELFYQALTYHCLRAHGRVPLRQLGMNVKQWITAPVSPVFRAIADRKQPGWGVEPTPDVVIFKQAIDGDWRRRNYEQTLAQMLVAVEVKVSERKDGRLTSGEIIGEIKKVAALREEVRHRRADVLPVVLVLDTARETMARMLPVAIEEAQQVAKQSGVALGYASRDLRIDP